MTQGGSERWKEMSSVCAPRGGRPVGSSTVSATVSSSSEAGNKETIHSGHFMVSDFEAEEQDDEYEVAVPVPEDEEEVNSPVASYQDGSSGDGMDLLHRSPPGAGGSGGVVPGTSPGASVVSVQQAGFGTYEGFFGTCFSSVESGGTPVTAQQMLLQHPHHPQTIIDSSLTKLFQCMSLAYRQKLTSPKWNRFKGMKLRWKDKIRLNNVIWRCWHMQFIDKKKTLVVQFASPLDVDQHNKPEAVVLEGKYWKRKLGMVTAEYKKWRMFYKNKIMGWTNKDLHDLRRPRPPSADSLESQGTTNHKPMAGIDGFDWQPRSSWSGFSNMTFDDDLYMDFSDTLFSSLSSNQPFAFPNPREIARAGIADIIQPGLVQLQPNLDDFMDFEPLHELLTTKLPPVPEDPEDDVFGRAVDTSTPTATTPDTSFLDIDLAVADTSTPTPTAAHTPTLPPTPSLASTPTINVQQQRVAMSAPPNPSQPTYGQTSSQFHRAASKRISSKVATVQEDTTAIYQQPQDQVMFTDFSALQKDSQTAFYVTQQNSTGNQLSPATVGSPPTTSPNSPLSPLHTQTQIMHHFPTPQSQSLSQSQTHSITKYTPIIPNVRTSGGKSSEVHLAAKKKPHAQDDAVFAVPKNMAIPKVMWPSDPSLKLWEEILDCQFQEAVKTRGRSRSGSSVHQLSNRQTSPPAPLASASSQPSLSSIQTQVAQAANSNSILTSNALLAHLLTSGAYTSTTQKSSSMVVDTSSSQSAFPASGQSQSVTAILSPSQQAIVASKTPLPTSPSQLSPSAAPSRQTVPTTQTFLFTPVPLSSVSRNDYQNKIVLGATAPVVNFGGASPKSASLSSSLAQVTTAVAGTFPSCSSPPGSSPMSPPKAFRPKSDSEKVQYKEHRRVCHINAEQKRRCNIKNGFDMLHTLIPQLSQNPNANKVSKATMLQKAAEYIRQLKSERSHLQEETERLKQQIESLNTAISNCQAMLPATGAPISRQRTTKMNEMFDEWVKSRTLQNWRFWIFSFLMRPLFESYTGTVSTANVDDMCRTTLTWVDQHCTLFDLRPAVLNSLRYLSTSTEVLTKPEKLPEEATNAVMRPNQRKDSSDGNSPSGAGSSEGTLVGLSNPSRVTREPE